MNSDDDTLTTASHFSLTSARSQTRTNHSFDANFARLLAAKLVPIRSNETFGRSRRPPGTFQFHLFPCTLFSSF